MSKPPKRRWFQYSLRTLLVLLIACAAFCGWRVYRARKNRERVAVVIKAVDEIEKLGGGVESEYEELRSQTWLEELFDDPGDSEQESRATAHVARGKCRIQDGALVLRGCEPSGAFQRVHFRVQDRTAFLHALVVTTADDLAIDNQHRTDRYAAAVETFTGFCDSTLQESVVFFVGHKTAFRESASATSVQI